MSTETKNEIMEVESIIKDIEPSPDSGGLVSVNRSSVDDILWLADNVDKVIAAQNKIRTAILKLAQPGDWTIFGDGDTRKAEIGFAGANRIGTTLGVGYKEWESKKIVERDELGEWFRWEFYCTAFFRNSEIRVYGRAGSRDKFFGKAHGALKPLHDVREDDIKVAAMRAAKKEGVRDLFGLHHLDPDFLTKNGVILSAAGGYTFKGKEEQAAETSTVNVGIENVLIKTGTNASTGKPWTRFTVVDAEGVAYTTFSETVATEAKKHKGSGQPIQIDFKKGKYGPDIISINGVTGGEK